MKIALLGYGKMGKMIEAMVLQEHRHEIALKINSLNRSTMTPELLRNADVAIEFSNPASTIENIQLCLRSGIPVAVGTTGWYDRLAEVKTRCEENNGAVVYASNFSIGVNIFFEINRRLAQLMQDRKEYKPMITEVHHTQKKDAPSGTAISLAKDMLQKLPGKTRWVNHKSDSQSELIILSRREENVVGIHAVEYSSEVDRIEIKHEAISRAGFAAGAILAAEWIIGKKGMFEFREMLNLH